MAMILSPGLSWPTSGDVGCSEWTIVLPFREGGRQLVSTDQLLTNVGIMFGVLILYWSTIVGMGWKLTNKTGVIFIFFYLIYVVYNVVVVWQLEKV